MIPRVQAIKIWEETSGFKVNPDALFWWELFTSVKGMAIWISMIRTYASGANPETAVGFGGIYALDLQRRILFDQMREVS